VGYVSRSSDLLYVEASRDIVSQYGLKTGEDTVWMVHVVSSRKLRQDQVDNG
jgi:hypothetical protein